MDRSRILIGKATVIDYRPWSRLYFANILNQYAGLPSRGVLYIVLLEKDTTRIHYRSIREAGRDLSASRFRLFEPG